jgi:predicted ribosome quality control (RQC) complex YloA/Tae2 family protein
VFVAPAIWVLRVRAPGATSHVVVAAGRDAGVGLARSRPAGGGAFAGTPAAEKGRVRAKLEGARLVGLRDAAVVVDREGERFVVEPAGDRVVVRAAVAEDDAFTLAGPDDAEALASRGAALVVAFVTADARLRRLTITAALARAKARLERRVEAVGGDLVAIDRASAVAAQAAAFVAAAARAPRGARSLTVDDWSSGEPRPISIPLDPARTAREQLDAMFRRARRLRLGRAVAERRLAEAEAARATVAALAVELSALSAADAPEAVAALDAIAARARAAAPRDVSIPTAPAATTGRAPRPAPRLPYRTFLARGGARILVGRGGADNDALTLHVARPNDLWLHAKGRVGAHVIVPLEKGRDCPAELLVDAAHLAAHFSDARDEGVVEVQHTPRRLLRKPKGAAAGFVLTPREKVIVLRVDRARVEALLASEQA